MSRCNVEPATIKLSASWEATQAFYLFILSFYFIFVSLSLSLSLIVGSKSLELKEDSPYISIKTVGAITVRVFKAFDQPGPHVHRNLSEIT